MGRKSSKIAAKKGAADKAKGQLYTKALNDVAKAIKSGGPDPAANFLLKIALDRCKKFNVPKDNIERAIKKGMGGEGEGFADVNYEGYGPGGVAIFVETSTNNTTRTVANVRSYFNKCHGSLGKDGCLQFIFEQKAVFTIPQGNLNEDDFTLKMIDAGAEDIELEEGLYEVIGPMEAFGDIQKKLQEIDVTPDEAGLERIPVTFKEVDEQTLPDVEKLIEMLEDDEDVVNVYHNLQDN
ncbi:MAG: YebC/PmpR family DNA-binding transcriptional regulator [Halobacteriovoraceae bacterium]|nr:YebC/PmpR family DNA-binding transcriptional regulator [Halobacteriovoraceae bacterium]MCB9095306.1 YebC/PmpR family DNA-binding transcriptional regulator [Halobacteriovoraceae bacterium]